ncbi:MAG: glyceraldehyde-3-phosphate dehydrogenase [Flavobacteriales bacterium]|nr:glyceraldehyde-3-phosphate dehydrogenase [Flavobacteriales bacterium]
MSILNYEEELIQRVKEEKAAVELIKIVSDLWLDRQVELVMFRKRLLDQKMSEILSLFDYAKDFVKKPINVFDALTAARIIENGNYGAAKIDLGHLVFNCEDKSNIEAHVVNALKDFSSDTASEMESKDVVLYGFGRIGRLLARELITQAGKGDQLRLRAIVVRRDDDAEITKRASLLRTDSVHGEFPGTVVEDFQNKALIINGHHVLLIKANNPEDIDYTAYGINNALVLDNTGVFTDKEALSRHLQAKGTSKVILTAPGKEIPNIVFGANHLDYKPEDHDIFSAASCTTNAITPMLKVVSENFGVEKGHIETVHAYTNDQNLVDNMHKKNRRGRAAALNMVITSTGAGKAVVKVIPSLEGKLTANAVRVPTPDGSLAILNLNLDKATNLDEFNETMRKAALEGALVEQIEYNTSKELVSCDIVGNAAASIYDSNATHVSTDGKSVVIYAWYDNEYGYSRQVMRLAKYVSNVRRKTNY